MNLCTLGYEDYLAKIKEVKVWAKLNCDYFVQYRSSWVAQYDAHKSEQLVSFIDKANKSQTDKSDPTKGAKFVVLHIQMDLCDFTLLEAMNKVNNELKTKGQTLTPIGYYIASQLLIEILESIDYMHKQNPPIIHRDLKPNNILITRGINNRFVKIGDFGLATAHESAEQSHSQMIGTIKYMAQEVLISKKYDTKADIYSLGVITQEMFNIDVNK
jgi:serine/threonine protein kinase